MQNINEAQLKQIFDKYAQKGNKFNYASLFYGIRESNIKINSSKLSDRSLDEKKLCKKIMKNFIYQLWFQENEFYFENYKTAALDWTMFKKHWKENKFIQQIVWNEYVKIIQENEKQQNIQAKTNSLQSQPCFTLWDSDTQSQNEQSLFAFQQESQQSYHEQNFTHSSEQNHKRCFTLNNNIYQDTYMSPITEKFEFLLSEKQNRSENQSPELYFTSPEKRLNSYQVSEPCIQTFQEMNPNSNDLSIQKVRSQTQSPMQRLNSGLSQTDNENLTNQHLLKLYELQCYGNLKEEQESKYKKQEAITQSECRCESANFISCCNGKRKYVCFIF